MTYDEKLLGIGKPVSGNMTYNEWLLTQPKAVQIDVLGPGRFKLWKEHKLSMSDMVHQNGRPLSIADLEERFEVDDFVSAKTIGEAEELLKVKGVLIEYSGDILEIDKVDIINAYLRTTDQIEKRIGLSIGDEFRHHKFGSKLKIINDKDTDWLAYGGDHQVKINIAKSGYEGEVKTLSFKDKIKLVNKKNVEDILEGNYLKNTPLYNIADLNDVISHELGHDVLLSAGTQTKETVKALQNWKKYYNEGGGMEIGNVPSFYAQENPAELFAESFVGVLKNQNVEAVKKVKEFINLLLSERLKGI